MNCPFTHTSGDKGCWAYIECGCLIHGTILLAQQALSLSYINGNTKSGYETPILISRRGNAKSTRKKAKIPGKEKRVRAKAN
jgi:hypothetical protein